MAFRVLWIGYRVLEILGRPGSRFRILSIHDRSVNIQLEPGGEVVTLAQSRRSPYTITLGSEEVFRDLLGRLREYGADVATLCVEPVGRSLRISACGEGDGRDVVAFLSLEDASIYDMRREIELAREALGENAGCGGGRCRDLLERILKYTLLLHQGESMIGGEEIVKLYRGCLSRDCWSTIKNLVGRGYGYTPEGDDIAMGYLSVKALYGEDRDRYAEDLVELCRRTHTVSCAMLKASLSLDLYDEEIQLVLSLARHLAGREPVDRVYGSVEELSRIGHSSGIMFSIGVLLGFNSILAP